MVLLILGYIQIKEAMHINWKKPELNKQAKHVGITISI